MKYGNCSKCTHYKVNGNPYVCARCDGESSLEMFDAVSRPKHYQLLGGKVEVKDIIRDRLTNLGHFDAYCYGNVIKYVLRAVDKDNFLQDLQKAKTYIEMLEKDNANI